MWNAGAVGDLDGRNFLVTGANTGIGLATVRTLAARGGRIWLAGRSEPKTREVMGRIAEETQNSALHYLELDLGSLSSVRAMRGRVPRRRRAAARADQQCRGWPASGE